MDCFGREKELMSRVEQFLACKVPQMKNGVGHSTGELQRTHFNAIGGNSFSCRTDFVHRSKVVCHLFDESCFPHSCIAHHDHFHVSQFWEQSLHWGMSNVCWCFSFLSLSVSLNGITLLCFEHLDLLPLATKATQCLSLLFHRHSEEVSLSSAVSQNSTLLPC